MLACRLAACNCLAVELEGFTLELTLTYAHKLSLTVPSAHDESHSSTVAAQQGAIALHIDALTTDLAQLDQHTE